MTRTIALSALFFASIAGSEALSQVTARSYSDGGSRDGSSQRRRPHQSSRRIGCQRRRPSGCPHQRQRPVRRRRDGHQPGGDRRRPRRQHGSHRRLRPRRVVARRQHRRIGARGGDQPEQRTGAGPRRSHQPQHGDRQLWPSRLAFGRRRPRHPGRAGMGRIRIAGRRLLRVGSQPQPSPGARRLRRPSRRTRRSDGLGWGRRASGRRACRQRARFGGRSHASASHLDW
jgi:hypothetical protein